MDNSTSVGGFLERGMENIAEGRFNAALCEWERGLAIEPEDVDLLANVAWFHFNRSRFAKALSYYLRLIAVAPGSVEGWIRAGNCLESLGLTADATQYYSQAVTIDPQDKRAGEALERLGKEEETFHRSSSLTDVLLASGFGRSFLQIVCSVGLGIVDFSRRLWERGFRDRVPYSVTGEYVRFLKRFDPHHGEREDTFYKCAEIDELRGMIPMAPGVRLLDLGSGISPFPAFAASLGCEVVCLDASSYGFETISKMAARVSKQRGQDGRVDPIVGDFRHLPFSSGSFNAVTAICTLEHVPGGGDLDGVQEIARVLAPGGRAFISVEARYQSDEECLEVPVHAQYVYDDERSQEMLPLENRLLLEKAQNRVTTVFVRYYSPCDLETRLAEPSGLKTVSTAILSERGKRDWRGRFNTRLSPRFGRLLAPLAPLAGILLFRPMDLDEFIRGKKLGIGTLVLEKPEVTSADC